MDDELRSNVLDELACNPRIRRSEIGAIVKNGAVTLTGMVATLDEKISAELAVKRLKGVRAVANDIEVKSPAEMRRADEHIAEQIGKLLTWYSSLRDMDVKAEVDDGRVTLTGEVDFLYQKDLAAKRVAELQGVLGVSNRIAIRDRQVGDEDLRRQITVALRRHANVESSGVSISIANGKIVLDGTVDTYRDRELIADAVRAAGAAHEIVDNLRVR